MATLAAASAGLACSTGLSLQQNLSSKAHFSNVSLFVKQSMAKTVCSAQRQESSAFEKSCKAAAALSLALAISASPLVAPEDAFADISGLTPCKESKAFKKRESQEVKKLKNRLADYAPDSAPALALTATIEKTHKRFETYGAEGLLCGTDGLPHLIVSGDQKHWGEFIYPGIVFLYITGWIGWVGREYLIQVKDSASPTNKEIIIDVPLAVNVMSKGFTWPLAAVNALRNGTLIEDDSKITVSPR